MASCRPNWILGQGGFLWISMAFLLYILAANRISSHPPEHQTISTQAIVNIQRSPGKLSTCSLNCQHHHSACYWHCWGWVNILVRLYITIISLYRYWNQKGVCFNRRIRLYMITRQLMVPWQPSWKLPKGEILLPFLSLEIYVNEVIKPSCHISLAKFDGITGQCNTWNMAQYTAMKKRAGMWCRNKSREYNCQHSKYSR